MERCSSIMTVRSNPDELRIGLTFSKGVNVKLFNSAGAHVISCRSFSHGVSRNAPSHSVSCHVVLPIPPQLRSAFTNSITIYKH